MQIDYSEHRSQLPAVSHATFRTMTTTQIVEYSSPNWPPSEGGKRLKGKYLQMLEACAGSLVVYPDRFEMVYTPEYEAFVDAMSNVFSEHLTPEHVETIIFRQWLSFESEILDRAGPLSAPENKDLLDAFVPRLKSFFESIPRRCTLRLGLPSLMVLPGLTPLAHDVSLVGFAETPSVNRLAALAAPSHAYLEITVTGYGDRTPESPAAAAALSIAKQFAFALQAFGAVYLTYGTTLGDCTFRESENSEFSSMVIPQGMRRSFSRFFFDQSKMMMYDWMEESDVPRGLLRFGGPGRQPVGEAEKRLAQDYLLTDVRRFFAARADDDFGQIAAAIEWYQDSIWADNDTFAYIAACIGLEAVLGSSDEQLDSLSKRLADRYAFLMGQGRKEREALRTAYGDVLKLRGRLVHGKAARLDAKERPLLKKVQDLLLQLLLKEILRIRPYG